MNLKRTNLIMEFGPYGGGSGRSAGGFSVPISTQCFNTWPFIPDPKILQQKEKERLRRRNRLRELALGWYILGPSASIAGGGALNGNVSTGAAPGKIF